MSSGKKPNRVIREKRRSVSIPRVIALGFAGLILLGALLLTTPAASRTGHSHGFLTGLFTATSATCVTGLVRGDTWSLWSPFGQAVILTMIEIGGLGFMSAASLTFIAFRRRKMSLQSRLVIAESIGADRLGDIMTQQRRLLFRSFVLEGAGALILTLRFLADFPFPQAVWMGVFHAVSAFCNAGFDILGCMEPGASMIPYQSDLIVMLTLSALIVLGGLGFLVWDDVLRVRKTRRLSVYTKLVLIVTGILLLGGTVGFCLLEWDNPRTLGSLPWPSRILAAFFQSVTLRTAGFAGIDQGGLSAAGKGLSIFLMLIGGSSGSTAGGLKTVTFVVLLMFLWNRMRGRQTVSVFHRTITGENAMNAITIFTLMIGMAFFSAILICATGPARFENALFETVSAIGTVGLSTGLTPTLRPVPQLVIILLMYFGRVGVLTVSCGFLRNKPIGQQYQYANADLMIG